MSPKQYANRILNDLRETAEEIDDPDEEFAFYAEQAESARQKVAALRKALAAAQTFAGAQRQFAKALSVLEDVEETDLTDLVYSHEASPDLPDSSDIESVGSGTSKLLWHLQVYEELDRALR